MEWGNILGGVLGALIVGSFGYLGVRLTGRLSNQAAREANRIEDRRTDIEEFREIRDALNERVDDLAVEVEHLKSELRAERSWRNHAVRYMRALLRLLHEHAPHVDVPEPPTELDLQLTYRPRGTET